MISDDRLLSEVPLFQSLDSDERAALAAVMDQEQVSQGSVIFHFGDPGDSLYIVQNGKVELYVRDHSGQRISFDTLEKGDLFGEVSLFDHGPRTGTAVALEDCELLKLDQQDLLAFLRKKPDAALDLLAVMGKRLRAADALVRSRVSRNPNIEIEAELTGLQKIASFIAEFGGSLSFLGINLIFFVVWIVLNIGIVPGIAPFDPYPFGFLTMAVSLEAIFLSIFVLLAQNVQAAKDRIRSDIEYEVNLKAELEVGHLHEKFDRLQSDVVTRLHRMEKRALVQ